MARVLAFDESSDASAAGGSSPPPPPPAQQPAAAQERAGATSRPLKRVARFLGDDASDSDDDNGHGYSAAAYGSGSGIDSRAGLAVAQKKRATTAQDVDRMFADLDDGDDGDGLPPPLKRGRPDDTQNSMIDDTITAFGNSKGKGRNNAAAFFDQDDGDGDATNDKIDAEKAKKPKRKPVVMNEERLLGDKGIRKLKENLKGFKIKGKGHEEDDLRRLMNVYQLWAHQMFPAGSFRDTITQVEKLCKKRSMKALLKGWRDEAQGKLPPPLAAGDSDEEAEGPARHANSDDDNEAEVLARTGGVAGSTTTSQAGSPSRPKKSYFDDIPTSSPGGALSRDPEMEEGDADMDLAESLFGSAAPVPNAGPSTSRNQPQHHMSRPMTTSEAGFNDMDLTFDLEEEDDFDLDAEAEAAMREMDAMNDDDDAFFNAGAPKKVMASTKGKQAETGGHRRSISTTANSVIDFYANPRASERRVKEGKSVAQDRNGPSSTSAPSRNEEDLDHLEEDENFDDFDFGNEEEDIMREMELAEKKQRDREAAALAAERRAAESVHSATAGASNTSIDNVASTSSSKTPSLTTSSSAQEVDLDLDDAFDEDFLKSIDEAEQLSSPQKNVSVAPAAEVADDALISTATSPSKLPKTTTEISQVAPEDAAHPQLVEEEEEDLYS